MKVILSHVTIAVDLAQIESVQIVEQVGDYSSKKYKVLEVPSNLTVIPDENVVSGKAAEDAQDEADAKKVKRLEKELEKANWETECAKARPRLIASGHTEADVDAFLKSTQYYWTVRDAEYEDVAKFLRKQAGE